jgi:hypothetical protein
VGCRFVSRCWHGWMPFCFSLLLLNHERCFAIGLNDIDIDAPDFDHYLGWHFMRRRPALI